jgi:hypothetical protein
VHPGRVWDFVLAGLVLVVAAIGAIGTTTTPDPNHFWVALLVLAMFWLICRRSTYRLTKVIAKTLQPWLLGMLIVGVAYLAATAWLRQTQWPGIFIIEKAAIYSEVKLKEVLPESILVNIVLLVLLFSINVRHPTWKTWTGRFQKVISGTRSLATVLAVVTSFTFFGTAQAALFVKATAEEKYTRLKDESTTVAKLILAARVSEHREAEAQTVKKFFEAVRDGICGPVHAGASLVDCRTVHAGVIVDPEVARVDWTSQREPLRRLVNERVSELRKYAPETPPARQMAPTFDDSRWDSMLRHNFSNEEIDDAKEKFKTGLDEFASNAVNQTFDPLSEMLKNAGLSDLTEAIVRGLYESEVSRMAKSISDPLADWLFRPSSVPAEDVRANVAAVAERPVFDETALPDDVRNPIDPEERAREGARRSALEDVLRIERGDFGNGEGRSRSGPRGEIGGR